jgi:hypothetical protein
MIYGIVCLVRHILKIGKKCGVLMKLVFISITLLLLNTVLQAMLKNFTKILYIKKSSSNYRSIQLVAGRQRSKVTVSLTRTIADTFNLVQILCFWTLSIILSLSKKRPVYFSKRNVSETGFCLHLQVKPTQSGPIDRASPRL